MRKFFKHSLLIGVIGIIVCIVLYATNLFYELVIALVEKSGIEGRAFYFIDEMVYLAPLMLIPLFVIYIIAGLIYMNRSQEKKEAAASKRLIKANAARQVVLDEKVDFLKHRYYSNCPKCGSVRVEDESECNYCGASLIIRD